MKRKLTALLLAMTFVFATVAPTMAAKPAKASPNKTAAVSVEESKKEKSGIVAFIENLRPSKSMRSTEGSREKNRTAGSAQARSGEGAAQGADPKEKEKFKNLFSLLDESGKNIDGAGLRIVKESGDHDIVAPWTSGQSAIEVSLPAGKYIFVNSSVTPGYKPAKPVNFEVTDKGTITGADDHVKVIDEKKVLVLEAERQDGKTFFGIKEKLGNNVTGAVLQIMDKDSEKVIHQWSSESGFGFYELRPGDYVLLQSEAPEGYEKADPIEFTIDEHGKINPEPKQLKMIGNDQCLFLEAKKETGKLFFSLRGIDNKDLAGANVTIKQDGKTFEKTFVTKDQPVELPRDKGEYELTVTKLPEGYKFGKDTIKFEIKDDGKVVPAEADKEYLETKDGNYTLFLKAEPVEPQVFFGLKDSNGKGIVGLELKIQGNNGKVISLVSGERAIGVNLSELPDGAYVFSQTNVRYGYEAAEPIQFTMKDGKVISPSSGLTNLGPYQELTLVSKSAKRVVTFSRVDSLGKLLLGAEIEIYKDGTKIASWKSGSDHHKLELEAGVYRYHEAAVVLGHKIAKDFEFEVKTDGSIVLRGIQLGENVKLKEGGHICVGESGGKLEEDPNKKPEEKPGQNNQKKPTTDTKPEAKNHWVEFDVAKKDGTLLEGAVVEIYQNGKLLESWTTSTTGYKTQLQQGSYRFHTKTAPQGYQLARDFNFGVNRDGSITLGKLQSGDTVTAKDGRIVVYGDPISATGTRTTTGTTTAAPSNGRLPKTGDGISPVFYAVGLAAVGAVILGIGLKKRRESVDEVK
ncbi:MSCRAMM family protein [Aedoeadaptatus coli]|uniref:MSCRAMM family protein n=1 Tax=Aedoeadaptatus coli TaxID=2058292 RepID=UPI000D5624E3|nr:SpaA isopeptide-forming pilin-related protein [Peptoniphilus coli]